MSAEFDERGFLVVRGFETRERRAQLRAIGDRVLEGVLAEPEGADAFENGPNIAFLTDAAHHRGYEDELCELFEWVADPRIVELVSETGGGAALFHNTQYFFEPRRRSWPGKWHRDTQFMAPDLETERARVLGAPSLHFRVALTEDACLELVPGSHRRFDRDEELAIRCGSDPASDAMPGRTRVELESGDACIFHAWMIHRGVYARECSRRTFDIIYGCGDPVPWAEPESRCFPSDGLPLGAGASAFYRDTLGAQKGREKGTAI